MWHSILIKVFFVLSLWLTLHGQSIVAASDGFNINKLKQRNLQTLAQLEADWVNTGGLEMITGGASRDHNESRWGHVSIRFVGSGRTALEDTVVEALGLTEEADNPIEFAYHGIFGNYPLFLFFASAGELIQSYYFTEARGYTRTLLPSTPELRQRLIDQLKLENGQDSPTEHYYFFSNNCMSSMAQLLAQVGFAQLELPVPFIPTQGSLHFKRSFLNPWPEVRGVEAREFESLVALGQKGDLQKASTLDLQRILVFLSPKIGARRVDILMELGRRQDLKSAGDVYGVTRLPLAFYQRDQLPTMEDIRLTFSESQLDQAILFDRAAWNTTYTSEFCRQLEAVAQCRYFADVRARLEPMTN